MKSGLFGINMAPCDEPGAAARVARAADNAGFEFLWKRERKT